MDMAERATLQRVEDEVRREIRGETPQEKDMVAVAVRAAILWLREANRWAWVKRLTKELVPRLRHSQDHCVSQLVEKMKSGELKTGEEQNEFLQKAIYEMAIEAGIETAKAAAEPADSQCPIIAP